MEGEGKEEVGGVIGQRNRRGRRSRARRGERHRRRARYAQVASFLERPRRRERGRSEGEGEAFASQREGNGIGMGRGREQRAGGRVDRGTQQQQTRPHVRAVGAGGGCWAGPGGREAEALCVSPCQHPAPTAAGRRGCGRSIYSQTTASRAQRG